MPFRLFVLVALLVSCAAHAACSRTLRVPFEDWPPYAQRDARGEPAGLDFELLRAVAEQAGCKLAFVYDLPRKRRLLMFQQGALDLLVAASATEERRGYAWFTRSYRDEEMAALARSGDAVALATGSLDELLARRIPVIAPNSGWYGADYERLQASFESAGLLTRYEGYANGVRLLLFERGRVLIGDRYALADSIRSQAIPGIAALPFSVNRSPVHFMLSRQSLTPADLAALDQAVAQLERRGALRAIRNRYLGTLQ